MSQRGCLRAQAQTLSPDLQEQAQSPENRAFPQGYESSEVCCSKKASRADTWKNFLAPEHLEVYGSSGLGIGFPGLEGVCLKKWGWAAGAGPSSWKRLLPQPCPHPSLAVTSPEAFPDGTEVLGRS